MGIRSGSKQNLVPSYILCHTCVNCVTLLMFSEHKWLNPQVRALKASQRVFSSLRNEVKQCVDIFKGPGLK